jgi:hypothetical protein
MPHEQALIVVEAFSVPLLPKLDMLVLRLCRG